jgi:hypothetical protein
MLFAGQFCLGRDCRTVISVMPASADLATAAAAGRNGGRMADLRSVSCPTASICEAVGESPDNTAVALRTTDGGAMWSVQLVP